MDKIEKAIDVVVIVAGMMLGACQLIRLFSKSSD